MFGGSGHVSVAPASRLAAEPGRGVYLSSGEASPWWKEGWRARTGGLGLSICSNRWNRWGRGRTGKHRRCRRSKRTFHATSSARLCACAPRGPGADPPVGFHAGKFTVPQTRRVGRRWLSRGCGWTTRRKGYVDFFPLPTLHCPLSFARPGSGSTGRMRRCVADSRHRGHVARRPLRRTLLSRRRALCNRAETDG